MNVDDIHDSIRTCDAILNESDPHVLQFLDNIREVRRRLKEVLNHWQHAHEYIVEETE